MARLRGPPRGRGSPNVFHNRPVRHRTGAVLRHSRGADQAVGAKGPHSAGGLPVRNSSVTHPARPSISVALRFWYACATSLSTPRLFFLLSACTAAAIFSDVTHLSMISLHYCVMNTRGSACTTLCVVSL